MTIRRVFISDTHMSVGLSLNDPRSQYDWFDADDSMKLAGFFDFLKNACDNPDTKIDELILLGDIFDAWVYPNSMSPPSFDPPSCNTILASKQNVISSLQSLIAKMGNKNVHYIRGNHDITITQTFLDANLGGIGLLDFYDSQDGIYAEHGHRFLIFNAPDPGPVPDFPGVPLPVGHYIARMGATIAEKEPTFHQGECLWSAIKEFLENTLGGDDNLIDIAFDTVINYAVNVHAIGDSRNFSFKAQTGRIPIPIRTIREMYEGLPQRWKRHCVNCADADIMDYVKNPSDSAFAEIRSDLSDIAKNIMIMRPQYKVVIFGHTHVPDLRYKHNSPGPWGAGPPSPVVQDIGVYANCGAWCDHNGVRVNPPQPYSYVLTETGEDGNHSVSLNYWDYGTETNQGPFKITSGRNET